MGMTFGLLPSCVNDDSDFSEYFKTHDTPGSSEETDDPGDSEEPESKDSIDIPEDSADIVVLSDTLSLAIAWNGTTATVTGETDNDSVAITVNNGDVIINSLITARYLEVTLSGETTDGSLLVYGGSPWGLILNGVSITNADGPAINNQCGKWLYLTLADGTENTLTDGTEYADAPVNTLGEAIDQKAALFSEGQIGFKGNGSLTVTGNSHNGIASDDYIVIDDGNITIKVAATGTNGVKVNDGMTINGGTLAVDVKAAGARGIKNDSYMTINGGTTTINTSGKCKVETTDGVKDTTSCAGIKCDSIFTMTGGQLTIKSTGDGGKGINSSQNVVFSGGTLNVTTTGTNNVSKPKGIKSETGIIVSGGSFTVKVNKSWACDNGSDSEDIKDMLTIKGTPTKKSLSKKSVQVIY